MTEEQNRPTRIELITGGYFDYQEPDPSVIAPGWVAQVLSRVPRFAGQTSVPYSVGQHSLLVLHIVRSHGGEVADRPLTQLAALCHDAPETVYGDVPTPLKTVFGRAYRDAVRPIDAAFAEGLGYSEAIINGELPAVVKHADRVAMLAEAELLMGSKGEGWFGSASGVTWAGVTKGMPDELRQPLPLGHGLVSAHWIEEHDRIRSKIEAEVETKIEVNGEEPENPPMPELMPSPLAVQFVRKGDDVYHLWGFRRVAEVALTGNSYSISFFDLTAVTFDKDTMVLAIVRS